MPKCQICNNGPGIVKRRVLNIYLHICLNCASAKAYSKLIETLKSSSGWMISNETSNGFNTAEFSKEVTQAMRRLGMKFTRWQGLEEKDGSLDKKAS
jgi:hypothetical protein